MVLRIGPPTITGAPPTASPSTKLLRQWPLYTKEGKIYQLGSVYEFGMPLFGNRHFSLTMPELPTGRPMGTGQIVYSDEMVSDALPEGIQPITSLKSCDRATVLCMGGQNPSRHNTLTVFGLVPGADVVLLQQQPSYVLRVGETELALDSDIAREILVQRVGNRKTALAGR